MRVRKVRQGANEVYWDVKGRHTRKGGDTRSTNGGGDTEGSVLIGEQGAERYHRATGKRLGDLAKAITLLNGRDWTTVPEDEQRKITADTGWQQYNNGWVYETQNPIRLTADGRLDFSDAPEVEMAYPQLHGRALVVDHPLGKTMEANGTMMWGPDGQPSHIGVNPQVRSNPRQFAETVFHEFAHMLQVYEGRGRGTNPYAMQRAIEEGRMNPPKDTRRADSYIESLVTRGFDKSDPEYLKRMEAAKQGLELYFTQGGEAEARALGNRIGMTPELRRLCPLLSDNMRGPLAAHLYSVSPGEISDHRTRAVRQDALGGDAGGPEASVPEASTADVPQPKSGPRIVINPKVFEDKRDALCVVFNEGFRVWMEAADFQPQSEPTDAQRKFFSDTAYADDEVQLRRTILARIATFDTSVKDPTDDQLAETGSFLDAILESPDWCKNDWERNCVSRLSEAVKASVGAEPVEPRPEPVEPREPEPLQSKAALGGGQTEDEQTRRQNATQFAEERGMSTEGFEDMDIQTVESVYTMHDEEVQRMAMAEPEPEEQTGQAQPQNPQQGASQEPGNPGQPEEPAQQDAQGAAQEPTGSQGAAQPGNEQSKPQNAPQTQEEPSKRNPLGMQSGIWTGGEEGKGRQLTAREAEWMKQRIDSGASVSGRQLSMFGLQRNERGAIVDSAGDAFKGFGKEEEEENKPLPGSPDAKIEGRERKRRKA